MKYLRIYTLLIIASLFASCSDDDEFNTGNATVALEAEMQIVKENVGLFYVPLLVSGEHTGNIQVTVKFTPGTGEAAIEEEHYIVTQKTVVIPAGENGRIEVMAIDNAEINENREFFMEITDVKGASIGSANKATISLKDNDANFYEKLQGKWKFAGVNNSNGNPISYSVTISGYDEGDPKYDDVLVCSGLMGYEWVTFILNYSFDIETKTGQLSAALGQTIATEVDFGLGGLNEVLLGTRNEAGLSVKGEIIGLWNEDFTTITFDKIFSGIIFSGTTFTGYTWFNFKDCTMTR